MSKASELKAYRTLLIITTNSITKHNNVMMITVKLRKQRTLQIFLECYNNYFTDKANQAQEN